jgi:hypothetical protein
VVRNSTFSLRSDGDALHDSRHRRYGGSPVRRPGTWQSALLAGGIAGVLAMVRPAAIAAQCVVPAGSNEARLLAFYEAPIVFAVADAPMTLRAGGVALTGELVGVPTPSASLQSTNFCFAAKQEGSHLAPILPRLRLTVGLPAGFALEGSYLPPVRVDRAQPSIGSAALSYDRQVIAPPAGTRGFTATVEARAHATTGHVIGPITCPAEGLQQTDIGQPCYGTRPSSDTFYPNSWGGEGTIGVACPGGRLAAFAGGGYTRLTPHFRVGFTDLTGSTDRTLVEAALNRGAVFGGLSVRVIRSLDAAAEVYSVPADLTTWRLSARYRL